MHIYTALYTENFPISFPSLKNFQLTINQKSSLSKKKKRGKGNPKVLTQFTNKHTVTNI